MGHEIENSKRGMWSTHQEAGTTLGLGGGKSRAHLSQGKSEENRSGETGGSGRGWEAVTTMHSECGAGSVLARNAGKCKACCLGENLWQTGYKRRKKERRFSLYFCRKEWCFNWLKWNRREEKGEWSRQKNRFGIGDFNLWPNVDHLHVDALWAVGNRGLAQRRLNSRFVRHLHTKWMNGVQKKQWEEMQEGWEQNLEPN